MDEILIPLAKDVSGTTYEMVDRFSAYAEALLVPIEKDKREDFITIAKHILKKTTKQQNDVGNLFNTLQKVTLTLVSERVKQLSMTEVINDRLPNLNRSQKQAIEAKARTFDRVWIENVKRRSLQLKKMIEKHKSQIRRLITAQEFCWKAESKYNDVRLATSPSVQSDDSLHQNRPPFKAYAKSRNMQIERQNNRLGIMTEMVASCKSEYEKKVGYEIDARINLHEMSDDLCDLIKSGITERLVYGINCLRDVIARFSDVDRYEECLQLVGKLNLQQIATSILKTSSDKYICPRMKDYNETFGFHTRIPAGKIVRDIDAITSSILSKDGKTVESEKSKPKEEEEDEGGTVSQSQYSTADDITEIPQDSVMDILTDSQISVDEQVTMEAPPSGIVQIRKPRILYVTVPIKVREQTPGLLKLKKGLRIKEKVKFNDVELSFGWYRPHIFSIKVWGFYHKHDVVLEVDK